MRKKLTEEQKFYAVCVALRNAEMPLSINQIGKRIGFANGKPIDHVVRELEKGGYLHVSHGKALGKVVDYFFMTAEGRDTCEAFLKGELA